MLQSKASINPFPGLRSYTQNESDYFFGREREIEDCLSILQQNKVLTLSGDRGVGKSSLIQAGIIPKLKKGFSGQAGRDWEVCFMRPGIAPIDNLSYALSEKGALYMNGKAKSTDHKEYKTSLENKRDLGLIDIYSDSEIFEKKNLIIVVDQLEDLFKFKNFYDADGEESYSQFVHLMNRSCRFKGVALYFIIAIDETFIGRFNYHERFMEILNNSLYHLTTLGSNGIHAIAEKTFHKRNVQLDVNLVDQLSDFLKEKPSFLPGIQYLFKKVYEEHCLSLNKKIKLIDIETINEFGGLKNPISSALSSFYEGLDSVEKKLLELICRGVTYGGSNEEITFYQQLDYLKALADCELDQLTNFLKKLNGEFQDLFDLFKSQIRGKTAIKQKVLAANDIIYIKYLSILDWNQFKKWQKSEYYNFTVFFENHEKAQKHPTESLLTSTSLERAIDWLNDDNTNLIWAKKYNLDYSKTVRYIDQSKEAFEEQQRKFEATKIDIERAKKRSKNLRAIVVVVIILALCIGVFQRHIDAKKSKELYIEMNQKASALDSAMKLKEQKEILIMELRLRDSLTNVQRQIEQKLKLELIQQQLMSQEKLISLSQENEKQSEVLEQKLDQIKSDSLRAIMLIKDAIIKEKFAFASRKFIDLKDSLTLLLYALNNTTLNSYDEELLKKLTASSIDLYDQMKALGNTLNRNYDNDDLRQIAVNLIAKLNGEYQYSSIKKHNLLFENNKPLKALNISDGGKIATGGESNVLYISKKNISEEIDLLDRITEFKSGINALEFISENLLAVGLENSEVWLVDAVTKEKEKIFPTRKWKPGDFVGVMLEEFANLNISFEKEYYKGVGFVEYFQKESLLIVSFKNFIIELEFEKLNKNRQDFVTSINLEDLAPDEFITSMTLSEPRNTIFVATNKGSLTLL